MKPVNILVVDDKPENLAAIQALLDKPDYCLITAASGKEAIHHLLNHEFALMLLDVRMPEMDGFEVAELVRQRQKTQHLPIIFLTATDQERHLIFKGYETGAVDYLLKPVEPLILQSKVQVFVEMYRQKQRLAKLLEKVNVELEQARLVQQTLMPKHLPKLPGVTLSAQYVPMAQLGGDFYDVLLLEEHQLGLLIADVCGHGVSAALLSFMASAMLKQYLPGSLFPAAIFTQVNQSLYKKFPEGKYVTVFYGIYDAAQHTLTYASAGHPPIFVLRPVTQEIFQLYSTGTVLGQFHDQRLMYEEQCFILQPHDKVLLYTDGLIEIENAEDQQLKFNGLEGWLKQYLHLPIEALLKQLLAASLQYSKHQRFTDDVTLVGLEIHD